jgi:YHS domain-containing protein
MMKHRRVLACAVMLLSVALASPAFAGEVFEKDGIAINGYDTVAYFTEMKAVKGVGHYRAEYKWAVFLFVSAANRDAFLEHPEKFAPQYGGFCAYGMAKGYKAATDPAAFTVVGDKLYLNYNGTVRALWVLDIPSYVNKADQHWPEVRHSFHVTY